MDDFATRLGGIERDLAWIREKLEATDGAISKLMTILDGNGRMGLCAKVNVLWHGHLWIVGVCGTVAGVLLSRFVS